MGVQPLQCTVLRLARAILIVSMCAYAVSTCDHIIYMVINSKFILCIRTACILMCQNGGTLDSDSCTCDCLPEFSGDVCESEFIRRGIHIDQKGETFSWEESLQGIEFGIDRINNFLSNCQAESHSIRSPNLCSFSLFCWCILFALCTIHKGPLTCLDEIWYVVETHWKLHKIKVVCVPSLGGKSLASGKLVSEIRHFELWCHSSLLAYTADSCGARWRQQSFESSHIHQEEACRIVV